MKFGFWVLIDFSWKLNIYFKLLLKKIQIQIGTDTNTIPNIKKDTRTCQIKRSVILHIKLCLSFRPQKIEEKTS